MVFCSTMYCRWMQCDICTFKNDIQDEISSQYLTSYSGFKRTVNHCCLMIVLILIFIVQGYRPDIHWLGLIYYCFCAIAFNISITMVLSVLNMIARDTRKFVSSIMRLLLYLTPILWPLSRFEHYSKIAFIMKLNPIYYIVCGYRDCFFYHEGFWPYRYRAICFWIITLFLFAFGSVLMHKFKAKFADLI